MRVPATHHFTSLNSFLHSVIRIRTSSNLSQKKRISVCNRITSVACSVAPFPPFFCHPVFKLHSYIRCCNQRRNEFFLPRKITGSHKSATTAVDVGLKQLRALALSTSSRLCKSQRTALARETRKGQCLLL